MIGAKSIWLMLMRAAVACAALLCFASNANAQSQPFFDREVSDSKAIVVQPLTFLEVIDLHFGNIYASNATGTVTVAPNGTRTKTGGVTLVGALHHPAEFAGFGATNQRVDISLGSNTIFINGPGAPMRVRNFVIGSTPTAVLTTTPRRFRIASATGLFTFPVGATLDVNANQAPGIYSGTWTITLNYQ
jgi:hypothetical protein